MFTASWCCSVGATWTVEVRSQGEATVGRPVEWICSGVPTQQPAPQCQTVDLLRERGLLLFPVEEVNSVERRPRSRSRRLIGYVTRDPEVMRLALMLADRLGHAVATPTDIRGDHPMVLAARWVQAGYSADAAVRWIMTGVNWPKVAHTLSRIPAAPPS